MVVTLLSDFGLQDSYVAQAKGILLQHSFTDHIIDISHSVLPFSISNATYILKDSYKNFPKKTIHLVLVNLLHAKPAKALLLELNDQWIVASDNGFLSRFVEENERTQAVVYELPVEATDYYDWITKVSVVIGQLYSNPHQVQSYPVVTLDANDMLDNLNISEHAVDCNVLHIDHYGNIIFAITQDMIEKLIKGRPYRVRLRVNKVIQNILKDYSDVAVSEPLVRFNRNGYLEVAIREDAANALLGYNLFHKDQIFYTTVKIEFYDR